MGKNERTHNLPESRAFITRLVPHILGVLVFGATYHITEAVLFLSYPELDNEWSLCIKSTAALISTSKVAQIYLSRKERKFQEEKRKLKSFQ